MPEQKRFAVYDLPAKRTGPIGVIVNRLDSQFIISALRGIQNVTAERGYDCAITHSGNCPEKEEANARLLVQRGVQGVLASPVAETRHTSLFAPLSEKGIPVIFFGRTVQTRGIGRVVADNKRCGYLATEHLIRQGCNRILLVLSNMKQSSDIRQHAGFLEALQQYRVKPYAQPLIATDLGTEGGTDVARKVLRIHPMPDGLFITDDQTAATCMHTLKQAGIRVPADIAIVGANNHPVSRLITPSLTTIDCPGFDIGRMAASALLDRLSASPKTGRGPIAVIPPTLIVRGSSVRSQHHWKTH